MSFATIPPRAGDTGRGEAADRLASLVAARLCHDLVSPLGAIGNGVELLEMSGEFPGIAKSPELTLIGESVRAARARVRFYRVAFGHAPEDQRAGVAEISQILQDQTAGGRLSVTLDATGDMPRIEARMMLLALMCLETIMPWGGRVLICRSTDGWRLVAEAQRTRDVPELWPLLGRGAEGAGGEGAGAEGAGARPDSGEVPPSEVHFAVLGALAADAGRPITWEADGSGAEISF